MTERNSSSPPPESQPPVSQRRERQLPATPEVVTFVLGKEGQPLKKDDRLGQGTGYPLIEAGKNGEIADVTLGIFTNRQGAFTRLHWPGTANLELTGLPHLAAGSQLHQEYRRGTVHLEMTADESGGSLVFTWGAATPLDTTATRPEAARIAEPLTPPKTEPEEAVNWDGPDEPVALAVATSVPAPDPAPSAPVAGATADKAQPASRARQRRRQSDHAAAGEQQEEPKEIIEPEGRIITPKDRPGKAITYKTTRNGWKVAEFIMLQKGTGNRYGTPPVFYLVGVTQDADNKDAPVDKLRAAGLGQGSVVKVKGEHKWREWQVTNETTGETKTVRKKVLQAIAPVRVIATGEPQPNRQPPAPGTAG